MDAIARQGRESRSGRSGDVGGASTRPLMLADGRDCLATIAGGMSVLISFCLAALSIGQAEAYAVVVRGWCGTPAGSIEMSMNCLMFLPAIEIPAALCYVARRTPIVGSLARVGVLATIGVWVVARFYMGFAAQ